MMNEDYSTSYADLMSKILHFIDENHWLMIFIRLLIRY